MIREEPAVAFAISSRPGCAYTEGGKVTGELFILKTTFSSSAFWGGTRNTDEKFFQISRPRAWDIFGACAATFLAELISGRRCTFRAMDRKPSTLVSAFLSCCQERGKNRETLRNFKLSLARISRRKTTSCLAKIFNLALRFERIRLRHTCKNNKRVFLFRINIYKYHG